MRPPPGARGSDIEKSRELLAGSFAVEQYDYCVAKRMQRAAFVGSYQERACSDQIDERSASQPSNQ